MSVKRIFLLCFLISLQIMSHGQGGNYSTAIYRSIPGIIFLTNDSVQDKIGVYRYGGGVEGAYLILDSNMHFLIKDFHCLGGPEPRDSGVWFVYNTGRIGLKSKAGLVTFDLLKYLHYYFCIAPGDRVKFIDAFQKSQPDNSDQSAYFLMDDFYMRDLKKSWKYY